MSFQRGSRWPNGSTHGATASHTPSTTLMLLRRVICRRGSGPVTKGAPARLGSRAGFLPSAVGEHGRRRMGYEVPQACIERYADLLVNWALGGGDGIKPGEVVQLIAPESAKPLYLEVCRAVWRAGGHVLGDYLPDD